MGIATLLLPGRCPVCERSGPAPCAICWADLRAAPAAAPVPAGLDGCRSLLGYEGSARELVARLKYRNSRGVVPWLAVGMAGLVDPHEVDVVTWAPTTPARRRRRGFDQAELLAGAVAGRLGRPCRRLLHRPSGPPQTGRSRAERRHGPRFDIGGDGLAGVRVLVVDDVVTSGATLAAAAAALRAAGAGSVIAVTAARTPLKVPPWSADA